MRTGVLWGLVVLASCYSKPPEPMLGHDQDAGGRDGQDIDASGIDASSIDASTACTGLAIDDHFGNTGGAACGTWGTPSGNLSRTAGVLVVTPPANEGNESFCTTSTFRLGGIVTLRLASVPDSTDTDYQLFQMNQASNIDSAFLQIYRNAGSRALSFSCGAQQLATHLYSNTEAWLRMTVVAAGASISVEATSSTDGTNFTQLLGVCNFTSVAPVSGYIRIGAGTEVAQGSPASTQFDDFTISCP